MCTKERKQEVVETEDLRAIIYALVDFTTEGDVDQWDDHFEPDVLDRVHPIVEKHYEQMAHFGEHLRKQLLVEACRLLSAE